MNRNEWIAVGVSLVFVGFLLFGGNITSIFGGAAGGEQENNQATMRELPSTGVETEDLVVGTGEEARPGDVISVHYVGALPSGTVFDSSLNRNEPFSLTLGSGQVIRGWDEGLVGMRVGGVRRLYIAPDYAYGAQAVGSIPANSTLIFEVQLLDVERAE